MNVVFLDIDGVVLPFGDNFKNPKSALICAKYVNRLCLEAQAKVVISSSWRYKALLEGADWRTGHLSDTWKGQQHWLKTAIGLDVEVIGMTPPLGLGPMIVEHAVRGQEILAWLDEHPEVTNWIAIDDLPQWLGLKQVLSRAVITEPCVGMTEFSVELGLRLFRGPAD